MRKRRLGSEGPEVSVVGLGCNNFGMRVDAEGTRAVVDAALDAGVTLFDTADIYGNKGGSESFLGAALEGRRDRVVLATKFGGDMGDGTEARGSRDYIRKAAEASLQRLRTDYIDLYQYHVPDKVTPFAETFGALDELVREGKVRHVGHSNLEAAEVEEVDALAREHGWARPVTAQNRYSLLHRDEAGAGAFECGCRGVAAEPGRSRRARRAPLEKLHEHRGGCRRRRMGERARRDPLARARGHPCARGRPPLERTRVPLEVRRAAAVTRSVRGRATVRQRHPSARRGGGLPDT